MRFKMSFGTFSRDRFLYAVLRSCIARWIPSVYFLFIYL